jgi:hypothetical protein
MTRTRRPSLLLLACTVSMLLVPHARAAAQTPTTPVPIEGAWIMTLAMPVGVASPSISFTRKGDDLSGTYSGRYGEFPIAGLIRGQVVTFTFQMGTPENPVTVCFTGEWLKESSSLKGTATIGELGEATWTAERDPAPRQRPQQ